MNRFEKRPSLDPGFQLRKRTYWEKSQRWSTALDRIKEDLTLEI